MRNAKMLNFSMILFLNIFLWRSSTQTVVLSNVGTPNSKLPIITSSNANRLTAIATLGSDQSGYLPEAPVWSPNGLKLAAHTLDAILIFDVPNFATPSQIILQKIAYYMTFSQDSSLLIYISRLLSNETLHVFDLISQRESYSINYWFSDYQISPNGKLLAIKGDKFIAVLDIYTGAQKVALSGNFRSFRFGSDSTRIAAIEFGELGAKDTVWIWDVNTGQRLKKLNDQTVAPAYMEFSPEGNLLAVQYRDHKTIILWDSVTYQQVNNLETSYNDTGLGLVFLFSPDNKYMASIGSGKVYLWQLSSGKRLINIGDIDPDRYGGVFNNDNSLLVYWDYNESEFSAPGNWTRLWSIPDGKNVMTLANARDPQLNPDGTMLASWGQGVKIWAVQ